nr:hypothetical protein 60 [bacterium]
MIGNRFNGDNIAQEFQRILEQRGLEKKAQALFESPVEDDPVEEVLNSGEGDDLPVDPASFLASVEPEADDISGALDSNIDAMDSASGPCPSCSQMACDCMDALAEDMPSEADYFDATANHIINGLGKIAGSLKSKGHGFASDIVEATAMSIRDDFVKEAAKKMEVTEELTKMAKELSDSGNQIAADMVRVTIDKIKKG